MSRAFVKEDVDLPERSGRKRSASGLPPGATNYITARGAKHLRDELEKLRAANTDSKRVAELEQILASVHVVDPPDPASKNGGNDKPRRQTVFPLLFFPHQRHFVLGQENAYHFKAYARAVWRRAEEVISNATEIRVIGYSFSGVDRKPFLDLLRGAKGCKRIVVQSPSNAEELCNRLGSSNADLRPVLEPASFAF